MCKYNTFLIIIKIIYHFSCFKVMNLFKMHPKDCVT